MPMQTMAGMAWLHAQQGGHQKGKPVTVFQSEVIGFAAAGTLPCPLHLPPLALLRPHASLTDRKRDSNSRGIAPQSRTHFALFLRLSQADPPGQPNSGPKICGARAG